ncbi:ribosome biogenesis GTPase YlqF [Oscillospiraceae bacterium OttesenSCG-928-G22]|nr:ribosome biogenesis GTPase YlqF [Oscillospiraceae bacterium OttesenSCG-928-G22]
MNIQWYPGHMTKTRRMIEEQIKLCDLTAEIVDARIPVSSRNPDIEELTKGKPRLIILNQVDKADPAETAKWNEFFRSQGLSVIETDCKSGAGVKSFAPAVRRLMKERIERDRERGQTRTIRVMILGVPNVGKSSLINRLAGRKVAKTEDRPGVTRGKQWCVVEKGLELLDTPGILWPKFEDEQIGMHLAFTGAVRDQVIDVETLAANLASLLAERYPGALTRRYKVDDLSGGGFAVLERCARKRGFLISGGEVDIERMANILLDEYRAGTLGRMTLEPLAESE